MSNPNGTSAAEQVARDGAPPGATVRPGGDCSAGRDGLAFPMTEAGNARRLAFHFGDDIRYVAPWSKYLVWDGCRWVVDDTGQVERYAKQLSALILREAAGLTGDAQRAAAAWAMRTQSYSVIRHSAALLASEPGIAVMPSDLDADPWMLNVANGTVDLRTGTLYAHERGHLITAIAPTAYDPAADYDGWDDFLVSIFPLEPGSPEYHDDYELKLFVTLLLGYAVTGAVSEQKLPILFGQGANGKSVLLRVLKGVLGPDYYMQAVPEFLMAGRDRHPTERADLFRRRLVVAVETGEDARLNEPLVKELTGGDPVRARRMREDFWEFDPTHKLVVCTNHKPKVSGSDHAIWRRLLLVPFRQRFWDPDKPDEVAWGLPDSLRCDKGLAERLLARPEGVLRWLVEGAMEWQRHGLRPPEAVTEATAEYRSSEDVIGDFLQDRCHVHAEFRVRASDLYQAYRAWFAAAGLDGRILSQKKFGQQLGRRGYQSFRSNGIFYRGLAIADVGEGGDEPEAA